MSNVNVISDEEKIKINELQRKMNDFFTKSKKTLYEREELVRILMLAILSKDHMFMYGPPGSAKTVVATALYLLTKDRTFFSYLMTDFTQYDEIFGKEVVLTQGTMPVRVLDKKLPTAYYAFVDEIFKGSAEILNSYLTIFNERLFDDGYNGRISVPLCTVLAASNEFPRTSYLKALFERFPLRIPVPNIKQFENRVNIFNGEVIPLNDIDIEIIEEEDINYVQKHYRKIKFTKENALLLNHIINTLHDLMNSDNKDNKVETLYEISGRTMGKIGAMLRLSAYVNMRENTDISDLLILRYMVWSNMFERGRVLPKLNQLIFGGESEYHGDTTKEIEVISIPTLRIISGIRPIMNGSTQYDTESGFKEFRFMLSEFRSEYEKTIKGILKIKEKLSSCKEKERLVEENIFLSANEVLDWRVDTSLIKINSDKFNDLSKVLVDDFKEIEVNSQDGKKYYFVKMIDKIIEIHNFFNEEMKKWLHGNETFFAYKIELENLNRR